jgi:hypothetical protein
MATKFLEPGGDADFLVGTTNGFWTTVSGASIATDFVHGGHIKSIKYRPNNSDTVATPTTALADAGSRISIYIYLSALPTASSRIWYETFGGIFELYLTSGGILKLGRSGTQWGSNGATLSTGRWYRISLAYTITSNSVNRFELFVDGVSSISVTNVTIGGTGTGQLTLGNVDGDLTLDFRTSDHYIDDSSALTDTGNIWVTAKRPVANGTTNGFTTQIGSGGSGYGSGHSPQVNERALSTTNGWSMIGAGSAVTEEYNIEGKAVGDLSVGTVVDWLGWVSVKALAGTPTIQIILNGANKAQAINTTITLYTKIKGSSTYPAGTGADIGIVTGTDLTTESLYECGILVAYIPSVAYTLTATKGSYTLTGFATLFKRILTIVATKGNYVLTGFATIFHKYWKIFAVQGSYVLTGNATLFHRYIHIIIIQGSYILTGFATLFKRIRSIVATTGTYVVTGFSTLLRRPIINMVASLGSYTLSGQIVLLHKAFHLFADFGTYVLTGIDTTFKRFIHILITTGTYTLTGFSASLTRRLDLIASFGAYTVTGFSSTFHKYWKITVDFGTYTLTGVNSILHKVLKALAISVGYYTLAGQNITLYKLWKLSVITGKYVLTGFKMVIIAPFHSSWKLFVARVATWNRVDRGN